MSDYERQIEEALARKARESEKNRKAVQTEAGLMKSLRQAFSENNSGEKNPEADKNEIKNLETVLSESSRKKTASRQEAGRVPEELTIDPVKTETAVSKAKMPESKAEKPAVEAEMPNNKAEKPAGETEIPTAKSESDAAPAADETERFTESLAKETAADRDPAMYIPDSVLENSDEKTLSPGRREADRTRGGSIILAVLLALFLAAAGISGGLFYALFTYRPMADVVTGSSCAAVLEGEYLTELNRMAEEEGLGIAFTREALVGGQAVRDIKASLKAAYGGTVYEPDSDRVRAKIREYTENAGVGSAEEFSERAGETYDRIIAAAPDSSWIGRTGSLRLIFLAVLAGGTIVSVILLVLMARNGKAGRFGRFSFAAAALLLEALGVAIMATGVFRRYSAEYSYITTLSNKYMMGGIAACMVIGAFYMVMACEATVVSAKK